jgi:hypothetical protein
MSAVSGHVFRYEGKRRPMWRAKYRLPDGRRLHGTPPGRDLDFAGSAIRVRASYTNGHLTTPKSGKVRSVPMAAKVAEALARLGQRDYFTADDDLVEVLAAKAERGYDVDEMLRRRGGRPPIGSGPASVESVRLDPELRRAPAERAERDHESTSAAIRKALRSYLNAS